MKKDEWIPVDGITLEDEAKKAVKCETNALVIAGPGAGKTELLAQKAVYLLTTNICVQPKKILAISFKKDSADNLKKRVIKRLGKEYNNRFVSLTYDSFFKSILDRFYRALPNDYSLNPEYDVIDEKDLKKDILKNVLNSIQPRYYSKGEIKRYIEDINSTLLPVSNNDLLNNCWRIFLNGNADMRAGLTFPMISRLTLLLIQTNEYLKKCICSTYSHVFLDEFQDTTSVQYAIVNEIFKCSNSILTAVGDNKQRIMLWAGAQKTIFDDFLRDYSAKPPYKLIMNHRSAPRLVELQKNMYDSLNEDSANVVCSDKWKDNDGEINLIIADNEITEAKKLAVMIKDDISCGTSPNDICILCKQLVENYSKEVINELANLGIRARIEIAYQLFLKDDLFMTFIDVFLLSLKRNTAKSWSNLMTFCEIVSPDSFDSNDKYMALINGIESLLSEVSSLLPLVKSKDDIQKCIIEIVDFFGDKHLKSCFPMYKQGDYFEEQLNIFCDLIWSEYSLANNNWTNAISGFLGVNSIPIMTIHKSKGLEYSAVYFIGLEDSAFWSFKNAPEEDRCAFFVALSRAKQKVSFTFCEHRSCTGALSEAHDDINEFFELLCRPEVAKVINVKSDETNTVS